MGVELGTGVWVGEGVGVDVAVDVGVTTATCTLGTGVGLTTGGMVVCGRIGTQARSKLLRPSRIMVMSTVLDFILQTPGMIPHRPTG